MNDRELFVAALRLPPPARSAFLSAACPDQIQKIRVESLLLEHEQLGGFLEPLTDPNLTGAYSDNASNTDSTTAVGDRVGPYKLLEMIGEGGAL